jgi:N-acetyl-anhydromuramyl-L-alanine amidase AmpD
MGLVPNSGKHRVLTNKLLTSPGHSANYGFFASNAPHRTLSGLRAWQPLGLVHTYPPSLSDDDMAGHVDYSEKVWLMLKVMVVDERLMAVADVASDPELAPLISSEGILKLLRYPGVSVAGQIAPLPYPEDTSVSFSRELRLEKPFMRGADVAAWQRFLRVVPDGVFGPITKGATADWQRLHMTGAELGLVDRRTVEAANEYLRTRIETGMAFVQARHFTKASRGRGDIYWIVLHTMEAAEKGTTAEACASYFHTVAKKVSAHYCLDNDSIVQCVRLQDVSYCAPGANKYGIHLEHAGYARQTATEWADSYSAAMLELSAGLTRKLRTAYDIPAQFVTAEMLREAKKRYDRGEAVPPELWGITTHHETTKAWGLSTHTDPGAHFPMQEYLDALR